MNDLNPIEVANRSSHSPTRSVMDMVQCQTCGATSKMAIFSLKPCPKKWVWFGENWRRNIGLKPKGPKTGE